VRNTGTRLAPFEIDLIERLDDLYLAASAMEVGSARDRNQAIKDGLAKAGKGMKRLES
jgi:phage regulator Rha-like protein